MSNDKLSLDFYESLKNEGASDEDALSLAIDLGLEELLLVRMLRGVYGLSLADATNLVRKKIKEKR